MKRLSTYENSRTLHGGPICQSELEGLILWTLSKIFPYFSSIFFTQIFPYPPPLSHPSISSIQFVSFTRHTFPSSQYYRVLDSILFPPSLSNLRAATALEVRDISIDPFSLRQFSRLRHRHASTRLLSLRRRQLRPRVAGSAR